jgi:pimeloyl-ACP methyl ester carboxylesterase
MSWSSSPAGNPYTNEGGARLAEGLLHALGVTEAVAVGHSAGALTAMELFKRNPKLIAGLAFVAPALPTNSSKNGFNYKASFGQQLQRLYFRALLQNEQAGLNFIRKRLRERSEEVRRGDFKVYGMDVAAPEEVIEGYLRPMRAHNWDRASLYSFRAFGFPGSMPYSSVTQPVLVLTGERDKPLTDSAKKVVDILQQRQTGSTQYVELAGCGHVPMDEQPQECLEALLPFVESVLVQQKTAKPDVRDVQQAEVVTDTEQLPLYPAAVSGPVEEPLSDSPVGPTSI